MRRLPTHRWFQLPSTWLIAAAVALVVGLTAGTAPLTALENLSRDWRFRVRGARPLRVPITIIAIDQKSLESPSLAEPLIFWGGHHARVFQILREGGARAIGFDLIQPLSLSGRISPDPDQLEAQEILATPQIVLAFSRKLNDAKSVGDKARVSETLPNQQFRTALALGGGQLGLANTTPDADGVVRSFAPADSDGSASFAAQIAGVFAAHEPKIAAHSVSIGGHRVARDDNGDCLINYFGPDGTFPRISCSDLLARPGAFRSQIKDHICLIGTTSYEFGDYHSVPFVSSGGHEGKDMAGIEVNANMVATLLSGGIWRGGAGVTWLCIGLAVVLSVPCCALGRVSLVIPAMLALIAGWTTVCVVAFVRNGWQLPLSLPVIALSASGVLLTVARLRQENAHKKWVEGVFGRYVSAGVLEHLMSTPGAVEIGGRRQIITVLFSDIRGFTSSSEQMEPEQVTRFLNNYLEQMVDVVFAEGGTIDKYMGDGIMALWNWPIEQPDHALRAARAALQMQAQVEMAAAQWRQMGFPVLHIGIGIHTGNAVLGNIGSPRRMEHTAIGDTVNVASRLESLTKELSATLGSNILLSQTAWDSIRQSLDGVLPCDFTVVPAGDTAIRGRQETLQLHAIMAATTAKDETRHDT